jgi:hypothetical protein
MRTGATGSIRVSKKDWYLNGGFANSRCWRRQVRGAWHYFMTL